MNAMEPQLYAGLKKYTQKDYLKEYRSTHKGREQLIIEAVYGFYDVEPNNFNNRKIEHCLPRQVAIYLIHERSPMTWMAIGKLFGKDHSTIIYSHGVISDLITVDKKLKDQITKIESILDEQ
jgi:chromosomal replication initiation ATPase DnaA